MGTSGTESCEGYLPPQLALRLCPVRLYFGHSQESPGRECNKCQIEKVLRVWHPDFSILVEKGGVASRTESQKKSITQSKCFKLENF